MSDVEEEGNSALAEVWPEKSLLAKRWDERAVLREYFRCHNRLLAWPSPAMTGSATLPALMLNRFVIYDIIKEWSSVCKEPRAPPIAWLRQEARQGHRFQTHCNFKHIACHTMGS